MNCIIYGLGRMGRATAWAMQELGYDVKGVDTREVCNEVYELGYCKDVYWGEGDTTHIINNKPDIVISCLPYFLNYDIAKYCIDHNVRYCDLGGSVPVEEDIIKLANERAKSSVFTGLGVAPGLISILALKSLKKFPLIPQDILLAVGGLHYSDETNFPTYYSSNWSKEGLLNEYFDLCLVLEDGVEQKMEGLSGLQNIYCKQEAEYEPNLLQYECFRTSGGLSNMLNIAKNIGVGNCEYKTIRYKGHHEFLKYLSETLLLNKEEIGIILDKSCNEINKYDEYIILHIELKKGNIQYIKDWFIYADKQFSAMQKTTAFTLASCADLMARNLILDKVCSYSSVIPYFKEFNDNLKKLGLNLTF